MQSEKEKRCAAFRRGNACNITGAILIHYNFIGDLDLPEAYFLHPAEECKAKLSAGKVMLTLSAAL